MVISLIILGFIVGLGFWTNHSLQTSAGNLASRIDKVSAEINDGRWEEAEHHTLQLEKEWERQVIWWPVFLDHQDIDNIEFSLAKIREYVANQDKALSMGQLSELKLMIEHIPEKEAVNVQNILERPANMLRRCS
jgi:hypothetical protein